MTRTPIDPPEYPVVADQEVEEETVASLRRLSTTCSQDPPEAKGQRGLDPIEGPARNHSSSLRSSMRSSTVSTDNGEAMVPYAQESQSERDAQPSSQLIAKRSDEIVATEPSKDMRFGFDHCFVTVPCKERLSVLFATLRRSSERKVLVVCSTWESAAFHAVLFKQLEMLHIYEMHEHMKDGDVAGAYDDFLYQYPGILFASEMSMREFDIPPNLDYLIQYEPPMNPTEYIYRMSNAKIYKTSCHKALLFLSPDQMGFLEHFDHIPTKELEGRKVSEFQGSVEKMVSKHSELNDSAWKAFRAFLAAYEAHSFDDVYDPSRIDEDGTRRSFGRPRVPEHSSSYFVYSKGDMGGKGVNEEESDGKQRSASKPHQWMDKEKTWGKAGKPWATREGKTWKHTKKSLDKI